MLQTGFQKIWNVADGILKGFECCKSFLIDPKSLERFYSVPDDSRMLQTLNRINSLSINNIFLFLLHGRDD